MRAPRGTAYDTFLRLCEVETDDCVLWPYSNDSTGYGQVSLGGRMGRVHRLACERAHGAPPTGRGRVEAAHSCNVKKCMNYRHLRWATTSENQADRITAGNPNQGERHGMAKLTDDDVRLIRHLHAEGENYSQIARRFSVGRKSVSRIIQGFGWTHVHGPVRPMLD